MKNKRIFQIIALFALFIPTYLAIYNITILTSGALRLENVTKVTVTAQNNTVFEYTEKNDVKIYIEMVDKATEVKEAIRQLELETPMLLTFFRGDQKIDYYMYLTLNNLDCILMDKDGKIYQMRSADADKLLTQSLSDVFFEYNHIPKTDIIQSGNAVTIYPSEGSWYLKKPDKTFKLSTIQNLLAQTNNVDISKDRPLDFDFEIEPDSMELKIYEDKVVIFDGLYSDFTGLTYSTNTNLIYVLTVKWLENELNDYHGSAVYNLNVTYRVPAAYNLSKSEVTPGEIVVISAVNISPSENISLSTSEMGYETTFFTVGSNKIAMLPIGAETAGKSFNITLFSGAASEANSYKITVKDKKFIEKNVSCQSESNELHMASAPQKEKKSAYDAILLKGSFTEKYWTDKFIKPYNGNILIDYGTEVTTNKSYPYINQGVNYSTIKGVAITAANSGKVIYTGTLPDDGKLVVIDHGFGVKSWYGHLDSITVKEGDSVVLGQEIGKCGKSGIFTNLGENLIFKISVGNVFVNPTLVIENGIPGIDSELAIPQTTQPATEEVPEVDEAETTADIPTEAITVPED